MQSRRLILIEYLFILLQTDIVQSQWIQTNGPYGGGTVFCFAVNENKIFAGTKDAGVFLSTNNGTSWSLTSDEIAFGVYALAISGASLFAGTFNGVFFSTNNGINWTFSGLQERYVVALLITDAYIFAGTDIGAFRSSDNGISWQPINTGINAMVWSFVMNGNNLFAGTDDGVFLSTNNGSTWTEVNSGLGTPSVYALTSRDKLIFAGTSFGQVFVSSNNGASWSNVSSGLPDDYNVKSFEWIGSNLFVGGFGGIFRSTNDGASWTSVSGISVCGLAKSGATLFAGTGRGIFLSNNEGASWSPANTGLSNTSVYSVVASGSNLFTGTPAGIYRSTDSGENWVAINSGMTYPSVYDLIVNGTNLFAGTYGGGVFLSTNNGDTWTAVNNGLTNDDIWSLAANSTHLFAGTDAGVFISANNGSIWTLANTGLTGYFVLSFCFKDSIVFAGTLSSYGDYSVFRSTNYGYSWSPSGLQNFSVYSFAVSNANIFAGTNSGVFLSTDYGTSWNSVNSGLPQRVVYDLVINGNMLFAAVSGGGVFLSTNNGTSWNDMSTGLTSRTIRSLAIRGTNLFAGAEGVGVWRRPLAEFLFPIFSVSSSSISFGNVLVGSGKKNYLYVSNTGSAILRIDSTKTNTAEFTIIPDGNVTINPSENAKFDIMFFPTTIGAKSDTVSFFDNAAGSPHKIPLSGYGITTAVEAQACDVPREFTLSQNYPNPFNPSTSIQFGLPNSDYVTLKIYNIMGQVITSIYDDCRMNAGYHTVIWDGLNDHGIIVTAGMYIYRLETKTKVISKKLILIR